ncbi:MAG: hypothetical protein WC067_02175 [Candidatus Methanomethylophilaceae archaeon]
MTQDAEFIPTLAVIEIVGDLGGMSAVEANRLFSGVISEIAVGCTSSGVGMIGHIKANFTTYDGMLSVSCTTDDGKVRSRSEFGSPVKGYRSIMNVIVYGIGYSHMCTVIDSAVKKIPGKKKVTKTGDAGCTDPHCKDPNCTDPTHRTVIRLD